MWCEHCSRLSYQHSMAADPQGFMAVRVEAIMRGDCTCKSQEITPEMATEWEREYRPEYTQQAFAGNVF